MSDVHQGHRARLRQDFLHNGLESFSDLHALELLLFYCIPRSDTNPLAHALLDRFKTLSGVLEASPEELCRVDGVGENTAVFLSLVSGVSRRHHIAKADEAVTQITSAKTAGDYFRPRFLGEKEEVVLAMFADARRRPLACEELSRGHVNGAEIDTRRLAELALRHRAVFVYLAHNHPSGSPLPSAEDEQTTLRLREVLRPLNVELTDQIIVAGDRAVSLVECGLL